MEATESFTLSEIEARKMRIGAILPLFLILPMAVGFGLDSSKSQPSHFLITFGIGLAFAAVFVSMSWAGVQGRINQLANTTLSIVDGKIVWNSGMGSTELLLANVSEVIVQERFGAIRSVILNLHQGNQTRLDGYGRMDVLVASLRRQLSPELFKSKKWLHI